MLAKVIPAGTPGDTDPGFGPRIGYICRKACRIEMRHLAGGWIHAGDQMRWIARLNPRRSRPCHHMVLSWSPLEQPDDDQMIAAARQVLHELGADDHQAIMAVHRDRPHPHIHIILNVIHPLSGRSLDLSHDYARLERACRRIELQMGWPADRGRFEAEVVADKIVTHPRPAEYWQQRRCDREEGMRPETAAMRGHERRTGFRPLHLTQDPDHLKLIKSALDAAGTWQEVHEVMQAAGWAYEPFRKGARIASRLDATWAMPASQLGARFSLSRMQDRLGTFVVKFGNVLGQAARTLRARLRYLDRNRDQDPIDLHSPDLLEPLFQESTQRRQQREDARQATAALRDRQTAECQAVRHHLGGRHTKSASLIRKIMHRQHREERQVLRESRSRRDVLPLATHLLAAEMTGYGLSLQYRLPRRKRIADKSIGAIASIWDHTACRQAWALTGMLHETWAPSSRLGQLLGIYREDLRFVDVSTILVAHRNLQGGVCGFSRIELDRNDINPTLAPGSQSGLILIGSRNTRRCHIVPDLRSAIVAAIMTAAAPELILIAPTESDSRRQEQLDQVLADRTVEIFIPKTSLNNPISSRLLQRYPEAKVMTFDDEVMLRTLGHAIPKMIDPAPTHS